MALPPVTQQPRISQPLNHLKHNEPLDISGHQHLWCCAKMSCKVVSGASEGCSGAHLQAGCHALALCHDALDLRQHLLARLQQPLRLVRTQCQIRLKGTTAHFTPCLW